LAEKITIFPPFSPGFAPSHGRPPSQLVAVGGVGTSRSTGGGGTAACFAPRGGAGGTTVAAGSGGGLGGRVGKTMPCLPLF